jgi:hypothetical protein
MPSRAAVRRASVARFSVSRPISSIREVWHLRGHLPQKPQRNSQRSTIQTGASARSTGYSDARRASDAKIGEEIIGVKRRMHKRSEHGGGQARSRTDR